MPALLAVQNPEDDEWRDGQFGSSMCTPNLEQKQHLKRHCEKIHKTTITSSGKYLCQQYGERFFKAEKLREHSSVQKRS